MTVLIISSFGATKNYPDQEMMRKTLRGFLRSLERQASLDFQLFISCHDLPFVDEVHLPFIHWCGMGSDGNDNERTRFPKDLQFPASPADEIEYIEDVYGCKLTDMSRKTVNSAIEAGRYACERGYDSFWMLRMDSDDLLAPDHVKFLNKLDTRKTKAVYNKMCHIFDPRRKEAGVQRYPYSTTCNALHMSVSGGRIERWDYLCTDHTLFMSQVHRDGIPALERDFTLCIITNSGNSISERLGIDSEPDTERVPLTEELIDRYGLEIF